MLPVDLEFGVQIPDVPGGTRAHYANKIRKRMVWAHEKAKTIMDRQTAKHKRYYDKKARSTQLLPGDRVLIRKGYFCGLQKLADRWESPIYKVIEQRKPDTPVYNIILEDGSTTEIKTIHRNRLLPLLQEDEASDVQNTEQTQVASVAAQEQFTCADLKATPSTELPASGSQMTCSKEEYRFWTEDVSPCPGAKLAAANQAMKEHFEDLPVVFENPLSYVVGWLFLAFVGQWIMQFQ